MGHELKTTTADQIVYAQSWARPFIQSYIQLSQLNSFETINKIAMEKCIRKFQNAFFKSKNSDFINQLNSYIHSLEVCHERQVVEKRIKIVRIYAHHFCQNDIQRARNTLDFHLQKPDFDQDGKFSSQICTMAFFGGISLTLICLLTFLILIPDPQYSLELTTLVRVIPIYRPVLAFSIVAFCAGFLVKFFRRFRINYIFILGIDPNERV